MHKFIQLMSFLALLIAASCATDEIKGKRGWPHDYKQDVLDQDERRLRSYQPQFNK